MDAQCICHLKLVKTHLLLQMVRISVHTNSNVRNEMQHRRRLNVFCALQKARLQDAQKVAVVMPMSES